MAPEYVNREAVRERVARLLDEYGREGVGVSIAREEPDEEFETLRGYADEGYLGGGYCFVVREEADHPGFSETMPDDAATDGDRVLLALGRYDETWGPPGGGRETGETFEEAAEREVREEVGVDCTVTDVVAIRHVTVVDPESDDEIHLAYVAFEAAYDGGTIDVQETEVAGAGWFGALPERLHEYAAFYEHDWAP
ncbi:NUDIX domain-containing protein [Halorubellus sp. JP-L1]|uniref:NUDIX domain-containing protein n=1 Tax=Halorubellus sp. JP-L1 TaxID=2715753 RepID=UPI00140C689A|nr:NUDIX domain-containing protein [Halorubellus sp. JP-L1]NHN42538.1 NUDIX domain-containing protein [Halorubellus sp. JP-L1]